MSYILFATTGGGLATPVSIPNGGTGAATASVAIANLTSDAFNNSAQSGDWGTGNFPPLDPAATVGEVVNGFNQLLTYLQEIGVSA